MQSKSTKKSLIASGLALLTCCALLAGTTFAWFTDSVVNKNNKIQAGTLDITLSELRTDGNYVEVDEDNPIFDYDLWEPGYSDTAVLRVTNAGSLAFKWNLSVIVNGNAGILGDVIDVYAKVSEGTAITTIPGSLDAAIQDGYTNVGTLNQLIADPDGAAHGVLYAATNKPAGGYSEAYAGIVLHMREGAGNAYQGESIGSTFDIVLNATQFTYEKDGFGNENYDASAPLPKVINSINYGSLQEAVDAANGDTVVVNGNQSPASALNLSGNITLNLGSNTIDANNHSGNGININSQDKTVVIQATEGGIQMDSQRCIAVSAQGSDITIDGGNYSVAGTNNAYFVEDRGGGSNTVTIENVTYTGDRGVQFSQSDNNTILIKNCTFTTTGYSTIFIGGNNNVCTLENVTVKGSRVFAADSDHSGSDGYSVINIKSGFYDCSLSTSDNCIISISGGSFSSNPTEYLADGYKATRSGNMWVVNPA